MDSWQKLKAENADLKQYIERLLNEPRYYLSQSIMKGKLKVWQPEIKAGSTTPETLILKCPLF